MPSDPNAQQSSSTPSSSTRSKIEDAGRKAASAGSQVQDAAKTASKAVGTAVNGAADALGGWRKLDKYVKRYNPTLAAFVQDSFLKKISTTNKPSKFLLCMIVLGILQSTMPMFAWPLDLFARLLSFVFLYNSGIDELKAGFGTSDSHAIKVKSLLTVYLLVSLFELVPTFAFDTTHHFGALWTFLLPAALFITPDPQKPKATIAVWVADSVFAQISNVIDSVVPDALTGLNQTTVFVIAGAVALLFWVGFLGTTGSYLSVYIFLFLTTTHHLGKDYISPQSSTSGFVKQMTVWHNLLAIWLWRYHISAIEGLSIPGIISVVGWIQYHIPSYFLWMTGFFFAMSWTTKTASSGHANTWYASWLTGKSGSGSKKSSSSSS